MWQFKEVNDIYVGEAVLRPRKHYIIAEKTNKLLFRNPHGNHESPFDVETIGVYCPSGYHPVSFTSNGYTGTYAGLLYVNDVSVKVKVYENLETHQKFFPEFGVPVR